MNKLFDVFISHASEDKHTFVRPLAQRLEDEHLCVWYDEFTLTLGDSLRQAIDIGLARSRFGIVVLSHHFFAKQWPKRELDGLVARETSGGEKVILPIWHAISKREVCDYSPTLADLVAVSSSEGMDRVVAEIVKVVSPTRSPLIVARDRLIEFHINPPVVTDEWWLDVVEASNRICPWQMFALDDAWGRWAFPLPEGESSFDRGEKLAWTAMQLRWTEAAESERISQVTPPNRVCDFIYAHPGLEEAGHEFPHYLATYAPQLTIPGFGGPFERDFDSLLAASEKKYQRYHNKRSRVGTACTITGKPPRCDDYVALHHPQFGDLRPVHVAGQFVQGDAHGPPCKVYPNFDYAIWLLSTSAHWLPKMVRDVLLQGMKDWAVWPWTDHFDEGELGIEPYPGMGTLANTLYNAGAPSDFILGTEERTDLAKRAEISKRLLKLPEKPDQLAQRFVDQGFIQAYLESEDRRRRLRQEPRE